MLDIQERGVFRNSFLWLAAVAQSSCTLLFHLVSVKDFFFQLKSVLTLHKGVLYVQMRVVEMCLGHEWCSCVSAKKQLPCGLLHTVMQ